jgi:membrane-associated phospholipid phosphatase
MGVKARAVSLRSLSLAALVAVLMAGGPVQATERGDEFSVNPALDGGLTAGAIGLWLTSELLKPHLAPDGCRFCSPNAVDDRVARAVAWDDLRLAARMSDVGLFAVVPAVALGSLSLAAHQSGRLGTLPIDLLLVAEATAAAQLLNQTTKFAVGRERPFVHWLAADQKGQTAHPADNDLSFFSGHTTLAFALVTSSYTVAKVRAYPWAPLILAAGLPLAGSVGWLRMAAGRHYLTDVLTGALVGTAVGVALPLLHRRTAQTEAVLSPGPQGLTLSGRF